MRRPLWLGLLGIAMLAALPGCAGFQQREWFAPPTASDGPPKAAGSGLFSWWRSPGSVNDPPAEPAETERFEAEKPAPAYQSVWPEPPSTSTSVFRFFPWSRPQPAAARPQRPPAPSQDDDPVENAPSVHLSARARRPKPHSLPAPAASDVELDVNTRQASTDEPRGGSSAVQGATLSEDAPLPRDLSASSLTSAAQPAPTVDVAPRVASATTRSRVVQTSSVESEAPAPPALLTDAELAAELAAEPAPEPIIAQNTTQQPTKPAPPPAPPITNTKPAPPPAPPITDTKPAPPPAPPITNTKPMTPPTTPPSISPNPTAPTAAPKPAAAPAPEPVTTPPPAPPVPQTAPRAKPPTTNPAPPSLQETRAAAGPRQSFVKWPSAQAPTVYASPQFPPVQFPAAYYPVAQRAAARPVATPQEAASPPAPQKTTPVASPPIPVPTHDHWHPGQYTMAFLQKCKDLGRGFGRGFGCCSCCTCPTCKKPAAASPQAVASPQASASPAPQPAPVVAAPQPAPVETAGIAPAVLINQLFPEGDPVLQSPSIRLSRAQPSDVAQGGQGVQTVLAQGLDEAPQR